jgi:hypothetical protein
VNTYEYTAVNHGEGVWGNGGMTRIVLDSALGGLWPVSCVFRFTFRVTALGAHWI